MKKNPSSNKKSLAQGKTHMAMSMRACTPTRTSTEVLAHDIARVYIGMQARQRQCGRCVRIVPLHLAGRQGMTQLVARVPLW